MLSYRNKLSAASWNGNIKFVDRHGKFLRFLAAGARTKTKCEEIWMGPSDDQMSQPDAIDKTKRRRNVYNYQSRPACNSLSQDF